MILQLLLVSTVLVSTVTGLVTVGRPTLWRAGGMQPCCRHPQLRAIAGANVRVRLRKPLGIVFEETKLGEAEGVTVADLIEDGPGTFLIFAPVIVWCHRRRAEDLFPEKSRPQSPRFNGDSPEPAGPRVDDLGVAFDP